MCEQFAELLLAPSVTDVASGRGLRIRLVSGLPLLHMERPKLRGVRRLTREFVDGTAAVLVLLLVAPVLASIAATTKRTSRGPVFIRQECVGRDGRSFGMLTFRSMVVGADRVADELAPESDGNGILFKKDDPCVTRIGRVLRRYALDKLPQRPQRRRRGRIPRRTAAPLQSDVDRYGFDIYRWFLVEPGLTGLWQISGSSDLSWDDSVLMDLRYVENWSLTFDLTILWKTVGAVLRVRSLLTRDNVRVPHHRSPEPVFTVLLVCTGNICRSALAERLGRASLAATLGDDADRVRIVSAGVRAVVGSAMHPDSALVLRGLGGDPGGFRARQLVDDMAIDADLTLTMTRQHRRDVLRVAPRALSQTFTLREAAALVAIMGDDVDVQGEGLAEQSRWLVHQLSAARSRRQGSEADDIRDPIGMPVEVHQEVGEMIAAALIPVLMRIVSLHRREAGVGRA